MKNKNIIIRAKSGNISVLNKLYIKMLNKSKKNNVKKYQSIINKSI